MQEVLHSNHTPDADKQRRFVITGLGGQGKSEICLKVANLMREKSVPAMGLISCVTLANTGRFWGVFWVDVSRPSTAERDFIAVAKILGRSVESISDAVQVLARTKQSWLLILDNADDQDFDYQVYLPSGTQGAIIITSRNSECEGYHTVGAKALEGLEDQYPKELLFKAANLPEESWPANNSQAEEVVRLLGSHTLALIQAGAYIRRGHCKLGQYPEVYRQQRKRLLKFRPNQPQSRYCDVYATFEASADVLKQSKNEAATDALRLLEILSMLDSGVFPLQIFRYAWDGFKQVLLTDSVETSDIYTLSRSHASRLPSFMVVEGDDWDSYRLVEASSLLISHSLVTRHDFDDFDGLPGLSMHPVTHAWAKDRQDSDQQSAAWIAAGCVLAFSRSNPDTFHMQERRLLPHVLSYLDISVRKALSFGSTMTIIPVLLRCGWTLLEMRQDSRLGCLLEDMFVELKQNPEEPSKESLPVYLLQAMSLINLGKNKAVVGLIEPVVKILETTLAEDHPDRLASQHMLASAYDYNGQVKKAVKLLEHVVKIQKTTLAKNHLPQLASQHTLAGIYLNDGQVKRALELLEQVVKIQKTTLAEDHPHLLASQYKLASAYLADGQVKNAVELLEQVVEIQKTTLAEDHPHLLASQYKLASAYLADGQVKRAVELLEQVVKIQKTTLAEDHSYLLASQYKLASAYLADGQVKKAVELLEQVVKIQTTTLTEDHPKMLSSQHELAHAYSVDKQVEKAVELLKQVVKIKQSIMREDHPDRVVSEKALAYCLHRTHIAGPSG